MTKKFIITISLVLFYSLISSAQNTLNQLTAKRTTAVFKIDGKLDEPEWKNAPVATNFVELRPVPFRKEEEVNRTEIFILYNDQGIYIGGYCHEKSKDSVATELVGRDNFGNNDFVGVIFDTYYDKINASEYFVTPLGEQMDAKQAPNSNGNSEDFSWSSVWESASSLQNDGWTFEMFLPYSALRFSKKDSQVWGMNIVRRRNKSGRQLFWAPKDPVKNGYDTQEGTLTIPDKIVPPLRLSFSPYLSVYANNYPYNQPGVKNSAYAVNGGMDVKYGINESFTLDATLVPDFGQVQSDNQVLNLTPFETKFNENRSFFTEGTELFNKGNLFYSRRIGGTPLHYYDVSGELSANEHIVKNPVETRLLNATKISGRTKGKLGIGFFNALSQPTYATIEDDNGKARKIETGPLTNYNIIVLNQSLKNNSSVTLVNTSVIRKGKDYDANVTAGLFDLYDKKNRFNFNGNAYMSTLFGPANTTGYKYGLGVGKVSGNFNAQTYMQVVDDKFNPNDLGIQFFNNYTENYVYLGYSVTKPHKWYNTWYNNFNLTYDRQYMPNAYKTFQYNYNGNVQLKNLWGIGLFLNGSLKGNDFYEARVNGRVYKTPAFFAPGVSVQSNNSKKYFINFTTYYGLTDLFNSREFYADFNHTLRFSNKFSVSHFISLNPISNNAGFPTANSDKGLDGRYDANTILFGRRDRMTIENRLNFKYSFNNKMYVTMRVRHYVSSVNYKQFYSLNSAGNLDALPANNSGINQYIANNKYFNNNVNIFNIDMVYSWRFAPGSEFNIVWKNGINTFERDVVNNYFKNFNNTLSAPQNNSVSIKMLYYIDYLRLRKKG
ncbi:MAG: carbohydrate binding family 9 domain-containing protein [Chitinophagaceae bacterium]|nr:carbohydrate binding family 9 domain-containing protein [Chitinophagaceae bacterium]